MISFFLVKLTKIYMIDMTIPRGGKGGGGERGGEGGQNIFKTKKSKCITSSASGYELVARARPQQASLS